MRRPPRSPRPRRPPIPTPPARSTTTRSRPPIPSSWAAIRATTWRSARSGTRAGNFGLAERYFRRAVETHPRDAEAWVGLAAAYDRLRRFDLADRAYDQAVVIIGPTAELLNNRGYSYMLRGDYPHARTTLLAAAAKDPKNPYVKNNLELLDKSFRNGKSVQ